MIFPAAVTPFDSRGRIDFVSLARLLAYFEAAGCAGVVLGGTNGEGPSLSAVEKRDLLRDTVALRGDLRVILGLATNSLDEAIWLGKRAEEFGAEAVLALPPSFFKGASAGLRDWFLRLMDASPVPVLAYHHPALVGVSLSLSDWPVLLQHENCAGVKASSGYEELLTLLPSLAAEKMLLMGEERDLLRARAHGWTGSISGCANVIPHWLTQVWREADGVAEHKLELLRPVLDSLRGAGMPAVLKGILAAWGILERADVRLPLTPVASDSLLDELESRLGMHRANLGLPRPVQ